MCGPAPAPTLAETALAPQSRARAASAGLAAQCQWAVLRWRPGRWRAAAPRRAGKASPRQRRWRCQGLWVPPRRVAAAGGGRCGSPLACASYCQRQCLALRARCERGCWAQRQRSRLEQGGQRRRARGAWGAPRNGTQAARPCSEAGCHGHCDATDECHHTAWCWTRNERDSACAGTRIMHMLDGVTLLMQWLGSERVAHGGRGTNLPGHMVQKGRTREAPPA